ncbi:MAG: WD40/YVTN/BNR-like repeat-containing protein [Candidatus Velthaea sp.]
MRAFLFALLLAATAGGAVSAAAQTTEEKPVPPASPSPAPERSPVAEVTPAPVPPYNRLHWREIGPAVSGGRVSSVVGSAHDPKLYYLGAAGGGVWKSANAGETWTPVFDAQSVSSIGAVAIDPKDDNVVWVGTGETNPRNDVTYGNGIYRSGDGGKTWKHLGLEATLQISSIAIDPRDGNTVVVGAMGDFFNDSDARGLYRTTDSGATWTKTLYAGPQSGISDLAVDPKNPDVMYAGMWQFRRVPWTFTSGGPEDGLYKSTDGGKTWSKLAAHGLPAGITGRIGVAVAPSDSNRVYALIESKDGILWRSDDAGANWTMVSKDTLVNQRPFYFSHVSVDPSNADHVYGVSEALSESRNAGKTFHAIARGVHVDYHSMWIAPNDAQRIIVGEDGGYAITLDGGRNWSFSRNLAIGQVYHVGFDDQTPYRVCAPLQDNNGFCGPSNSLNPNGIPDDAWERVVGGDGMWAWPDPRDANLVWTDSQNGNLSLYDRAAKRNMGIAPYRGTSGDEFALDRAKYRFNWDAPIAFAPWDRRIAWYGANVVFETRDRGMHWHPISPDLTRNVKEHQKPSGGPLALDVSSAEFSDNILHIEASSKHAGEIWVGTDDGLVQLTLDGGAHWKNVTPAGVPAFARVETVAPSPLIDGTAYAVFDRHMSGDRTPYVYVTHDHGRTWSSLGAGLPHDQEARSVRPDTRNPHLVFAGLENSIWSSYDDGAHWTKFNVNLPPVAIYDIRIQPRFNDLIVATHGRSVWIFDDLAPVQALPQARAAGAMLFAPRPAYAFGLHSDDEGLYTRFGGKNPPGGAVIAFYQATSGPKAPATTILDAHHKPIRTIAGSTRVNDREVPQITNDVGLNRFSWDLREDGPVRWNGAAREEYRGPRVGAPVVPGRYFVRMTLGGRSFEQPVDVKPDPRLHFTSRDYAVSYAFAKKHVAEYSAIDAALNRIDGIIQSAKKRLTNGADGALDARLNATVERAQAVKDTLTADFHNDEDSLQRPGKVREDMQRLLFGALPLTDATRAYAARIDAAFGAAMKAADMLFRSELAATSAGGRERR